MSVAVQQKFLFSREGNGWTEVPLGDLCRLVNGKAFAPGDWADTGLPIIRIQNLNDATKSFNYWAGPLDGQVMVSTGDVLLGWSGTPGTSFGAHIWNGGPGVLNQHIFRVDLDETRVAKEWAVPAINHRLEVLIGKAHGGVGLRHVKKAEVESLLIPLPLLPEQKRVARILKDKLASVERARAAAEAQLEAAKALPAAYRRAVFPLRGSRGEFVAPLTASRTPPTAPHGWRWRLLRDLARLESGHTPSRYRPEWWGGSTPWLALPDIRQLDGKIVMNTTEYTNKEGIANSSARILPTGTVCLSRTASVGFVTIMGRPMATSQDFVNWVCGSDLRPSLLMHLLIASRDYIRSLSSGAVHKTVYVPTVKEFRVCIPGVEKQEELSGRLNSQVSQAEQTIRLLESHLKAICRIPASLLRAAFQGRL